jgi:SAM-dependent methyltransferase
LPSLNWNQRTWNTVHTWDEAGEEWSHAWGSADMQWYGAILPRLQRYLPARHILEIAPGYGRWTQYLADSCEQLTAVDLSSRCIEYCRKRFAGMDALEFHAGDGRSLSMVGDASVDLVFSFDSLVHVELDIIQDYMDELSRVLAPAGIAFLHHSNLGRYARYFRIIKSIKAAAGSHHEAAGEPHSATDSGPARGKREAVVTHMLGRLRPLFGIDSDRSRALSVSAEKVAQSATEHGLTCISQEQINWGTRRMIDCISVIGQAGTKWPIAGKQENPHFMAEADRLGKLAELYSGSAR